MAQSLNGSIARRIVAVQSSPYSLISWSRHQADPVAAIGLLRTYGRIPSTEKLVEACHFQVKAQVVDVKWLNLKEAGSSI